MTTQTRPAASIAERLMEEGLISLRQVADMLPPTRKGTRVSPSAIYRWITIGKLGVKLEGIRLGGDGYWTSKAAVARFAAALTHQAQRRR